MDVILKRPLILISWIIKWAHIVKTSTYVWSRIIIESNLPSIIAASTLFILLVVPILAAISVPILIPMCIASSMIMMTMLRKIVVDNSSISHSKSRIFNFLLLRWVQLHHLRRRVLLWEIFRLIRHDKCDWLLWILLQLILYHLNFILLAFSSKCYFLLLPMIIYIFWLGLLEFGHVLKCLLHYLIQYEVIIYYF